MITDAERGSLYRLVQQCCDRPAYFWHCFTYNGRYIEDFIQKGYHEWFRDGILMGYIRPDKFCEGKKNG